MPRLRVRSRGLALGYISSVRSLAQELVRAGLGWEPPSPKLCEIPETSGRGAMLRSGLPQCRGEVVKGHGSELCRRCPGPELLP